jgi:formyl-CoA transferase
VVTSPALGEHSAEVYGGLGIEAAELDELKAAGVV